MKVESLKKILNKFPDDYEVCIDDADTGLFLDICDISKSDDTKFVCLSGSYYHDLFTEDRSGMQCVYFIAEEKK